LLRFTAVDLYEAPDSVVRQVRKLVSSSHGVHRSAEG
jgi:hypothetical protein